MDRIKNRNSNLLCRTVFLKRTGKETLEKQVRPRKCKPFNVLLLDPLLLLSDHTDYFLSKPPCVRTSKLLDCENLLHSVWKLQKNASFECCIRDLWCDLQTLCFSGAKYRKSTILHHCHHCALLRPLKGTIWWLWFRTACQAHSFFVRNRSTEFLVG